MAKTRIDLQKYLEDLLGSKNVYYNPPESIKLRFPAIVYSLSTIENIHAEDESYLQNRSYMVTYISKNPDDKLIDKLSLLPYVKFNRTYCYNNYYHSVFIIYF